MRRGSIIFFLHTPCGQQDHVWLNTATGWTQTRPVRYHGVSCHAGTLRAEQRLCDHGLVPQTNLLWLERACAFGRACTKLNIAILSEIYSDILSGILSGIRSGILSDLYSAILSEIYSDMLSDILSGILSDLTFYLTFSPWHSVSHSFWHST